MRKTLGTILLGLAAFLITTALLVWFWVPGAVMKTPLNVDSLTRLTGQAAVLPDGSSSPVRASSHTVIDGKASDGKVSVFDTFTCVWKDPDGATTACVDDQDSQNRLVTASTDRFATDRRTGVAINDAKYVGADASTHEGLINKFPFLVEKKDYAFFDGLLAKTVNAAYQGTEKIDGLEVYKYVIAIADEPAEISSGIQGTYSDDKTMWIDPVTGSIINQTEHQIRKLESGATVLDLQLQFADDTLKKNVSEAKANGSQLGAVQKAPLICLILGLLSAGAGVFLRRGGAADAGPANQGTRATRSA